jgi:hypothetical protein
MAQETLSARYKKYLRRYPAATYEQFLQKIDSIKTTPLPSLIPLPGGGFAAMAGISKNECARMTKEFVVEMQTNQ